MRAGDPISTKGGRVGRAVAKLRRAGKRPLQTRRPRTPGDRVHYVTMWYLDGAVVTAEELIRLADAA